MTIFGTANLISQSVKVEESGAGSGDTSS